MEEKNCTKYNFKFFFIVKNTYYIFINGGRGKHPRTKLLPDVIGSKQ